MCEFIPAKAKIAANTSTMLPTLLAAANATDCYYGMVSFRVRSYDSRIYVCEYIRQVQQIAADDVE